MTRRDPVESLVEASLRLHRAGPYSGTGLAREAEADVHLAAIRFAEWLEYELKRESPFIEGDLLTLEIDLSAVNAREEER